MSSTPRVPASDLRGAFALQPALFDAFWSLYSELWMGGTVDHATKEVVRLRNARVTDCGYCRNVRFSVAREEGLDEDTAAKVDDGYEGAGLPPHHVAALRLADRLLHDPSPLPDDERAVLATHFTDEQVVELAAALAMFVGFAKLLICLGLEPEPGTMDVTVVPTPGSTAST